MDNNVKKIDNIKCHVQQLIQDNLYREVKPETKHNISGVYMIYIDNFTSEEIVPFYIGQAKDIQKRYKQHFEEILALNRLSYDEYKNYFYSGASSYYEGKFKACKIFKYMIENKCTLQEFRITILEEVEEENLNEKELEYFQRLLPSFFGFNQFNSFLKQLKFRFSNSQMSNSEINEFLSILLEDVKGILSYYEYGFTRFNFEHAFPKNLSLLEEYDLLSNKTLLKYDVVKLKLDELCQLYKLEIEKNELKNEIEILDENIKKLEESQKNANDEYNEALNLLRTEITEKFKELNIYTNKIPINNFISSIFSNEKDKYRERFYKYLKGKKCELDFYELFVDKIKNVNTTLVEMNNKNDLYKESCGLRWKTLNKNRHKRYKLIFPTCQFETFSLGDMSNNLSIKIDEEYDLLNTCHINIYISNNGNSRSDIRKDPHIIRIDYCYIDNEGNKLEKKYYIENATTKNCQTGIEYFELNYGNPFGSSVFKISSIINNEIDNSFISVLAEYKHGINDYTIKDKKLIELSNVLNEIQQLIDENTRFSRYVSETNKNCLESCMINERLQNNTFLKELLTNKLPKIKKKRKSPIKKAFKKVVNDKTDLNEGNKITRSEAYRQKVLKRSDNTINVLNYVSSREKVTAQCTNCGYKWEIRSDHLLRRPYCPPCSIV